MRDKDLRELTPEELDEKLKQIKSANRRKLFLIIIIILLLFVFVSGYRFVIGRNNSSVIKGPVTNLEVSDNQTELAERADEFDGTEYTEYTGYGTITLSEKQPEIYLENSKNNTVYMQYDVMYDGEKIYSSELIAPGKMEPVNVYKNLDKGTHTLTYDIDTYDIDTKELCMAGVVQEQVVNVKK